MTTEQQGRWVELWARLAEALRDSPPEKCWAVTSAWLSFADRKDAFQGPSGWKDNPLEPDEIPF